jgi:hypothetical protein
LKRSSATVILGGASNDVSSHGEERSDEAIQKILLGALDFYAELVIGRRHGASKTRVNALLAPTRWLAVTK